MVMLGEPMRFIAYVLKQTQCKGGSFQPNRVSFSWQENLFFLFGERKKGWWRDLLIPKGSDGGIQLPLSAVDQENVGETLLVAGQFRNRLETTSWMLRKSSIPCTFWIL